MTHHTIEWIDRGREPQCPPNPDFQNGKPLRLTDIAKARAKHCKVDLPYPAKRCGIYIVRCQRCSVSVGVTTAGRPDDPTYIEISCRPFQDATYIKDGQVQLGPAVVDDQGNVATVGRSNKA